jgi:deazaflavin-dependent oxidoreductase (nitroreductase family)
VTAIEIPPPGTRGTRLRGAPVWRAVMGLFTGLYRFLGGRLIGRRLLLLETVGARSGRRRTAMLFPFAEGDGRWLVVGSNAGAARHPAWFINLARNPDLVSVQVGRERVNVRPELLAGAERAGAWQRILAAAPGYGRYEGQTDREIPIVRLTAAP